jgi:hypothetical protein
MTRPYLISTIVQIHAREASAAQRLRSNGVLGNVGQGSASIVGHTEVIWRSLTAISNGKSACRNSPLLLIDGLIRSNWKFHKVCITKLSQFRGSLSEVRQKSCRVNPSLRQRCVSHLASKGIALVDARISLRRTSSSPPLTFSGILVGTLFRSLRANDSPAPSAADTRCSTSQ